MNVNEIESETGVDCLPRICWRAVILDEFPYFILQPRKVLWDRSPIQHNRHIFKLVEQNIPPIIPVDSFLVLGPVL